MNAKKVGFSGILLILVVLLLSGCNLKTMDVGPLQTEEKVVELGGAERVSADVDMGVGKLQVAGGAGEMMEATFAYNIAEWQPQVAYDVAGSSGELAVSQPDANALEFGVPTGDVVNTWDLSFNESVPLDLNINFGVGEADIKLGGLNLSSANISSGVGEVKVDLTGKWTKDVNINVEGGVGQVELRLPGDVGVIVQSETGLGGVESSGLTQNGNTYTNSAYGTSDVTLTINVEKGIGEIKLVSSE